MLFVLASATLLYGSLSYGFSASGKSHDENSNLLMAQEYIKQNNYDKAYNVLRDSEENSSQSFRENLFSLILCRNKERNAF